MLIVQLLGGFEDAWDGCVAGEQGEEEAVSGFGGWDGAEKVGML